MKTVVVYSVPLDNWDGFRDNAIQFASTFKQFPPGADHELWAICASRPPSDEVKSIFDGIEVRFIEYKNPGLDAACDHLYAARHCCENRFLVCMTARHYFWKEGWLKKMVEARNQHGPGLYGICANRETYPLHVCLRFYGMDSDDFHIYPHQLSGREDGHQRECFHLLPWMRSMNRAVKLVLWDGVYDESDWFSRPNRFRHGDQSNVLVWDRHTDSYRDGTPEHRAQLEAYQLA